MADYISIANIKESVIGITITLNTNCEGIYAQFSIKRNNSLLASMVHDALHDAMFC